MAQVKTTLAAIVATLFGNSEKVISEKLSTEEYNDFTADANQAAERIATLENEKATAEANVTSLTTRATTAETKVSELTNEVTSLTAERDKYKGWFDKKAAEGNTKPAEDASNKSQEPGDLSGYNAGALAHYRKAKGGRDN